MIVDDRIVICGSANINDRYVKEIILFYCLYKCGYLATHDMHLEYSSYKIISDQCKNEEGLDKECKDWNDNIPNICQDEFMKKNCKEECNEECGN